jgi:hypothetical protein
LGADGLFLIPLQFDGLPLEEEVMEGDGSLEKELAIDNIIGEKIEIMAPVTSPSLDFNDNEDIPTELSDSSDTHDEGEPLNSGLENPLHLSVLQHVSSQKSKFWISVCSPYQAAKVSEKRSDAGKSINSEP